MAVTAGFVYACPTDELLMRIIGFVCPTVKATVRDMKRLMVENLLVNCIVC